MKNKKTPQVEPGEEASPGAEGLQKLSPSRILDEAIRAVPAVKYALGVTGIVAAIAIVRLFNLDLRIAAFGTIVTFALMVALVIFAALTKLAPRHFLLPVLVMVWSFLILVIATAVLLFTSVFFKKPVDLMNWLKPTESSQTLPSSAAALPAAGVLKVAYVASPPPPTEQYSKPRLDLGIVARRKGAPKFNALKDGESLASEVDDYCVVGRALSGGYLYVFQVDSSGKAEWLFPRNDRSKYSSGSNPLVATQTFQIPAAESAGFLYLDRTPGIEHLYAVFSATRWPELEAELAKSSDEKPRKAVGEPIGLGTRGVGGVRVEDKTGSEATSLIEMVHGSETLALPILNAPLEASGHFFVEERWFRHTER
jgi:hypothetical protein